jgi:hypothetical protein
MYSIMFVERCAEFTLCVVGCVMQVLVVHREQSSGLKKDDRCSAVYPKSNCWYPATVQKPCSKIKG